MSKPKITALILARMTSARLPGKGLMEIAGRPLLWHIVERIRRAPSVDEIVLATTDRREDQPLLRFAEDVKIKSFAYDGEVDDVLSRIIAAGRQFESDILATISGDCPLVDPGFTEDMIQAVKTSGVEVAKIDKSKHKCMHEGVGVLTRIGWEKLGTVSTQPYEREHAGIYLNEHPDFLTRAFVEPEPIFQRTGYRISVDNLADLQFMRAVYGALYEPGEIVDLKDVVHLLETHPKILAINAHVSQKGIHDRSKKVTFVADAGVGRGLGHLRRCLAIARELHETHHCGVKFITGPCETTRRLVSDAGFQLTKLVADTSEANYSELVTSLQASDDDVVIIDKKGVVAGEVVRTMHQNNRVSVVLDNSSAAELASLLVMPAAHLTREVAISSGNVKVLQGAPYVLINPEFKNITRPEKTAGELTSILVSIGGSDPNGVTKTVVAALLDLTQRCTIRVVVGPYFQGLAALREMPNIEILEQPDNMAEVLAASDLAIVGFGVTVYEAAFLGVPVLMIAHSETDAACAEILASKGLGRSLGAWNHLDEKNLRGQVDSLIANPKLLAKMGAAGKHLIDGEGAKRVADEIMNVTR